jgi:N6-adenosine-specific RNA methylase IME4
MIPIASVIVADPPWLFGDSLPGPGRGAAKHYPCMTTRDLMALRIPPVANDALLFLWRVGAMQQEALDVAKAWGFEVKSEIDWQKLTKGADTRKLTEPFTIPAGLTEEEALALVRTKVARRHMGLGRYTRADHEICLIGTRGRASKLIQDRGVRSSFDAAVGEHSAKPDAFYELVERLAPGPYVELFARRKRKGWTTLGTDLGHELQVGLLAPTPRSA